VLLQHFGRAYFHARVIADADGIAAVGHGIATGPAGWIGNIIVRPEARNRGFGSRITAEIIDILRSRGCSTLLLIATQLGEPVYRKFGFRTTGEYVFLRVPPLEALPDHSIRRLQLSEANTVCDLDAIATGESRGELLAPHVGSGWGHVGPGGVLDGFFLPSFGSGFVMACEAAAGLALLRFKHAFYSSNAVIPADNAEALSFLRSRGAEETTRAPRMALGEDTAWRPETIFGRAAGYCG
jgi:GNAT superfamily N-acetyltransferase